MIDMTDNLKGRIVALSGGVGGAKLALGLRNVLPPGQLNIIANTADDFEHLSLSISPDIDTVLYTLSGLNDEKRGWGLANETWSCMEALGRLGAETWFQLGDKDIATHLQRSMMLRQGRTLTDVTRALAAQLKVGASMLPMCDEPVRTMLDTDEGEMEFQHYFVRRGCQPRVRSIRLKGIESAKLSLPITELLAGPVAAIIICPSNPFVSVDPILAVPGMRQALRATGAPILAISPIIAGKAVKGPTAKIFDELGMPVNQDSVASHYAGFADILIVDEADRHVQPAQMRSSVTNTMMTSLQDKERLARAILELL